MATPSTKPIAEHLFDGDLPTFVADQRAPGVTWRDIELAVNAGMPDIFSVSYETLRTWYGPKDPATRRPAHSGASSAPSQQ